LNNELPQFSRMAFIQQMKCSRIYAAISVGVRIRHAKTELPQRLEQFVLD